MEDDDCFLRYEEAARLLRCSVQTLRKKVARREVPFIKPFGRKGATLFSERDLRAFLKERRIEPQPDISRAVEAVS
jgi:excisionase family DNA binding protein